MKILDKPFFSSLEKIPRLNLINSCMGYKSANLIVSQSKKGIQNVAIFSSVTHLGSDPALLGFILRPTTVPRDTYKNIKETEYFTINQITKDMIEDAHHTSASYDEDVSEFDKTNLEIAHHEGINMPFIAGSPVQLLCKYINEYEIKENNTIQIIASIEKIIVDDACLLDDYWIRLDHGKVVCINGLDGYALPTLIDRFAYARPNKSTESIL